MIGARAKRRVAVLLTGASLSAVPLATGNLPAAHAQECLADPITGELTNCEFAPTATTINFRRPLFFGKLFSTRNRCRTNRLIILRRVTWWGSRAVAATRSTRFGNWYIRAPWRVRGRFYAVAKRRVIETGPEQFLICRWDRSPVIRVRRPRR